MEEPEVEPKAGGDGEASSPVITPEGRSRMERNRLKAQKRLLEKSAFVSEVLTAYRTPSTSSTVATEEEVKAKKRRMELNQVISQGSVVHVQGTKLIDTGGGFLIEERDLIEEETKMKEVTKEDPPFIPEDVPRCLECNLEFQGSFLLKNYDHRVCDKCKDMEDKHQLITRTDAKNEYLLKDVDLDKRTPVLGFVTRPNPHNSRWGDMKLYLRLQVEERAKEVWGSLEAIEEQQEKREENRVKTKVKKWNRKMKELRMGARSSLYVKEVGPHEHQWGEEEEVEGEEDQFRHKCVECGQEEIYEKM